MIEWSDIVKWTAVAAIAVVLFVLFVWGLNLADGAGGRPRRCDAQGVQSVHNGPGDGKTVVCRNGTTYQVWG